MSSDDVIARFYPHGDFALEASIVLQRNPRYLVPPRLQSISPAERDRGERESTVPPEDLNASPLDYLPSIVVRLSDIPRTSTGFTFGASSNSDLVLPLRSVSGTHFCLTFDDQNRPILRDVGSLMGTQVTYPGKSSKGEGYRSSFQWIIGGHPIPEDAESIIVSLQRTIAFKIIVPSHDISSPEYVRKVEAFKRGSENAMGLLNDLGLSQPSTRLATGTHTPCHDPISIKKRLGNGSFGVASYLWNVSTGDVTVVKEPHRQRGAVKIEAWLHEARIMGQISHPAIVRLLGSSFSPHPQLFLEYMPGGSLNGLSDISFSETLDITSQCLSGLTYLHDFNPPIVHRDIKLDNIFVHYRFDNEIHVKLGDFGLAQDTTTLKTLCGSYQYLAPEIYADWRRSDNDEPLMGHTAAVDIWSLGVVACNLVHGLPTYEKRYEKGGLAWCRNVTEYLQRALQRDPTGLEQVLLDYMVVMEPESRGSAPECGDMIRLLSARTAPAGPFPSFSGASDAGSTIRPLPNGSVVSNTAQSTVVYQPRSSTTVNRGGRSGAPPQESHQSAEESFSCASSSSSLVPSSAEPSSVPSSAEPSSVPSSAEPSSTVIRQRANPSRGQEYDHFRHNYSTDSFHPLLVGSSLASQFGKSPSNGWTSQSSAGQSSVQQRQSQGQQGPNVTAPNENPNTTDEDDHGTRESVALLQEMSQGGTWK